MIHHNHADSPQSIQFTTITLIHHNQFKKKKKHEVLTELSIANPERAATSDLKGPAAITPTARGDRWKGGWIDHGPACPRPSLA
jgi:hypothetical protein